MKLATLIAAAALGVSVSLSAQAAYPDKPIKVIVGFPPGGPLDTHGRLLAEKLQTLLGQSVVIDYRPGAGGSVGAASVAKAPPDGYTLMLANTGVMVINPAVYPKLSYDTLRDFVPIARTAQQPLALVAHPTVPVGSVQELVSNAQAHPGQLNYGSAGNGGISHLVPEMFKHATNTQIVHVPYKGTAPALTDLLGGQVQLMADSVPSVSAYVKQGKLRALAVTGRERSAVLPDVPTFAEAGVAGMDVVGFYGVLAPSGTPPDVVDKLSGAFRQVLADPELRRRMAEQGADPAYLDSSSFSAYLRHELPVWAEAVRTSGAAVE